MACTSRVHVHVHVHIHVHVHVHIHVHVHVHAPAQILLRILISVQKIKKLAKTTREDTVKDIQVFLILVSHRAGTILWAAPVLTEAISPAK